MNWLWPQKKLTEIETSIAIRLGRFVHWGAVAFVGLFWLGEFVGVIFGFWANDSFVIGAIILAGIVIVLLARGLRYVFANE
jgi:hypothetical protein